ncbi:hypothetical protein [Actinoplanes teichomyceticus]|nr:hypothetical protein [Actinoplanes teichomyceticus]
MQQTPATWSAATSAWNGKFNGKLSGRDPALVAWRSSGGSTSTVTR